jgi:hypothetical protein
VREGFRIYLDWLNHLESPQDIARDFRRVQGPRR